MIQFMDDIGKVLVWYIQQKYLYKLLLQFNTSFHLNHQSLFIEQYNNKVSNDIKPSKYKEKESVTYKNM